MSFEFVKKLPAPNEIKRDFPVPERIARLKAQRDAEIRDVIAEMFKEQKTFEIVDERRHQREQKELDAREQKMLDEIGTNACIKKQGVE